MQSTTLIRALTFVLVCAGAAPQVVFAGHAELVQQHRFTRAELSGVLYLPGNPEAAVATGEPLVVETPATIITASKTCGDSAVHSCATTARNP